jgi:hypothetical protein
VRRVVLGKPLSRVCDGLLLDSFRSRSSNATRLPAHFGHRDYDSSLREASNDGAFCRFKTKPLAAPAPPPHAPSHLVPRGCRSATRPRGARRIGLRRISDTTMPTMTSALVPQARQQVGIAAGMTPSISSRTASQRRTALPQSALRLASQYPPARGGTTSKTFTPSGKLAASWSESLENSKLL